MAAPNVPICVHFQRGYCAFGNHCRYLHSRFSPYNHHSSPPQQQQQQQPYYNGQYHHYSTSNYNHYNNYNRNGRNGRNDTNYYNHYESYSYSGPPPPIRDRSSSYSSLFPTKREEYMDSYIDSNKETLVFDIDGTIADIENRLTLAPGTKSDGTRSVEEWNIVLDGVNYKYDRVIPVAWAYLKYIESQNKYNILYLSGRRSKTIKASMNWLFNINKFPKGYIIHRFKGMSGQQFKQQQLIKLNDKLKIAGYFGDRIIDDCICCIKAGVRPILVVPNQWLFTKHIYGGIQSVINDIVSNHNQIIEKCKEDGQLRTLQHLQNRIIPSAFIDVAKNSKYWNMGYEDLIPIEFATELFDDKNKELLPPNILLKCQENEEYWKQIMDESNTTLLLKNNCNESNENEAVEKFIENSDSEIDDNKTKIQRKIKFCYDQQSDIKPQYRWVPVGQSTQKQ